MIYMQNTIYNIWNLKTYLCTDRICAYPLGIQSPVGPIPKMHTKVQIVQSPRGSDPQGVWTPNDLNPRRIWTQVIQSPIRQPSPLRPCNNKENCSASRTRVRPLRVVHTEHLPDQFLSEALVPREQGWLKFDLLLEQFKNQELFLKIKNLQSRNTFLISWIKNTSWLLHPLPWIFLMQSYWTPRKPRT